MSKAIEGAALLAGAVGMGVAAFMDPALIISPIFDKIWASLIIGGISMEAGALADSLLTNRGTQITVRQAAAFRQVIRGEQRVGGVEVYVSTTGSHHDQYNMVIVLAGHVCDSIVNLYLDGRQVFWNPTNTLGNTTRNGVNFGGAALGGTYIGPGGADYDFGTLVYCEARYGDQSVGDVITGLTANDPNWAADGHGNSPYVGGCTYVYLKMEYDTAMFPSGPGAVEVRFTVRGKQVYDPRTQETAYSTNWALHVADVLQSVEELGDLNSVNEAQLIAAANVCDEQVPIAIGGTESRYSLSWHYDTAVSPGDVLSTMMTCAAGRLSRIGGEWYIWPAYWQGPSFDFSDADLANVPTWNPYKSFRDLSNRVNGTYIAPNYPYNDVGNLYDANGWYNGAIANNFPFAFQPTNYPQYAQDTLHGYAYDALLYSDSGVLGNWDSTVTYSIGDVVVDTGVLYKSLIDTNLDNDPLATPPAAWSISTTYALGDLVTSGPNVYISLIASNVGNTPSSSGLDWQVVPPAWVSWVGNVLPMEVTQSCCLSVSQAQRVAKILLMRNRQQGTGTFPMQLWSWTMQPLDVFTFSFDQMSWSDKVLEVVSTKFSIDKQGDYPSIRFEIEAQETDSSVYDWSITEELSVYDVPSNLTSLPYVIAAPTGLALSSSATTALIASDGTVTPRILATWTAPVDQRTTQVQIQHEVHGSGVWVDDGAVDASTTSKYISGVLTGTTYDVRIRAITAQGALSAWTETDNVTVVAPNSLQTTYTNNPPLALTNPTSTSISVAAVAVTFGNAIVTYTAQTITITAPGSPTWLYVTIPDALQQGGSIVAVASTTTALVGVVGHTYLGAILALPAGGAISELAGGWPAQQTFQVVP